MQRQTDSQNTGVQANAQTGTEADAQVDAQTDKLKQRQTDTWFACARKLGYVLMSLWVLCVREFCSTAQNEAVH